MTIKVCLAGVTGWTGKCIATAVIDAPDLALSGAVARSTAAQDVGEALGRETLGVKISASVEEALLTPADVFVDFTRPEAVKAHTLQALARGVSVVIGTSGLTAADFTDIEREALKHSAAVISCGNFSITAALAKHFALLAARFLPQREIIDYAHAGKPDAPSGTVQELAEELAAVRANMIERPLATVHGAKEARGAQIAGTPVHSLRLPGYVISFETIFGLPDQRLSIRHDSGSGAQPYVDRTLLAIRKTREVKGLVRGLDKLLFGKENAATE